MACKGSGVQIPSAPPDTTHLQVSLLGCCALKVLVGTRGADGEVRCGSNEKQVRVHPTQGGTSSEGLGLLGSRGIAAPGDWVG